MALRQWPCTHNVAVGSTVSVIIGVYDDAGGTITNVRYTNSSASLGDFGSGGRLEFTLAAGVVTLKVHTSGMANLLPGFFTYDVQLNGSGTWVSVDASSAALGGQLYCYTDVPQTISIGATTTAMSADLPSLGGATTLNITFTDPTGILDGGASNFKITNTGTLYGGIHITGGGTLFRLGSSTTDAVKFIGVGDAPLEIDHITFDTCGAAAHYENTADHTGQLVFTNNTIQTNSTAPAVDLVGSSSYNIFLKFSGSGQTSTTVPGSPDYRSRITGNRIGKCWIEVDGGATDYIIENNVMQGYRCGYQGDNSGPRWTFQNNYVDTQQASGSWSQVAGFYLQGGTMPDTFTNNIFREAEWQIRAMTGGTVTNCVFSECSSHAYIDGAGGSTQIISGCIFLYGNFGSNPVDISSIHANFELRGSGFTISHCTFANPNHYPYASMITMDSGVTASVKDCLFTGQRIYRGGAVSGEPAIGPAFTESATGSPMRPATNANRLSAGDHNGWFDNSIAPGGDTYANYGVGTVSGSPGTGDVSADPKFVTGTYTWPSDANIWARVAGATLTEMLASIRSAFTLGLTSPMRSAASDGTHIGAVQSDPASSAGLSRARYLSGM